jgi:hypothetical protein
MTKDEALKMAIEVLDLNVDCVSESKWKEAINACKEALEQPTQGIELKWYAKGWDDAKKDWQGLTDKEIFNLSQQCDLNHILGLIDYGRAVEQALKDKNSV